MKNFLTNESEIRFNEVVFENRHKNYGAYDLRSQENYMLKKALFIGVSLFVGLSVIPIIANGLQQKKPTVIVDNGTHVFTEVPIVKDRQDQAVKPVAPKPVERTRSLEPPTPTAHPEVETPMPKQSDIANSRIGTENRDGEKPTDVYKPVETTPVAPIAPVNPVTPKTSNEPVTNVDVEASFNGGIDAFRSKVQNNFDVSDFEGSGEVLKTTVTFIVEKDGTISSIKANGSDAKFNAEAEKTIRGLKGKWTPAKLNGEFVRSYFRFPIAMKFE